MSRKVLSKEEFLRRALADLAAANKLVSPVVQEVPKKPKRKCIVKRKKYPLYEMVERIIMYA